MAIGSRSQSARTYLEKHLDMFPNCTSDELIAHGLRALRDTLPNEVELTTKVTISIVLLTLVNHKLIIYIQSEELLYSCA